jgi:class 3 adenylate cyclase
MREFLQTYFSYMKAAVISMACATAVFFLVSGTHKIINTTGAGVAGLSLAITMIIFIIILSIRIQAQGDYIKLSPLNLFKYFYRLALSDAPRLRLVGGAPNVHVIAMVFDLCGAMEWATEVAEKDPHYVKTFIDELHEWIWNYASASSLGRPTLTKFLGDGLLFVWEVPTTSAAESATSSVRLGYLLHKHYMSWVKRKANTLHQGTPVGIGIGIDTGSALRLTLDNGYTDYLGAPISYAAKLQDLAQPDGGLVIRTNVWMLLDDNLRSKFLKGGVMKLGDRNISVRMIEDAELKSA